MQVVCCPSSKIGYKYVGVFFAFPVINELLYGKFHKVQLMRQKFTLITLGVKDFQKALAFYEGLGWKKSGQSQEAYALFPLGGIVLGLYPLQELEKDTTLNYQQASFQRIKMPFTRQKTHFHNSLIISGYKSAKIVL